MDHEKLANSRQGEKSATVREQVESSRERQRQYFANTKLTCNTEMGPTQVREHCKLEPAGQTLLKAAMSQLHLSACGFHRIPKPARTIADLAGSETIAAAHLAEAVQYLPRDRA